MAKRGVIVEINALAAFTGDLDALRDDIRERIVAAADRGVRAVQRGAQRRVPKDRGDLSNAIEVAGKGISRAVGISGDSVPSRGGHNLSHLSPWSYGEWIERGLKSRHLEAQPFMGPAADTEEPNILRDFEQAVDGALL